MSKKSPFLSKTNLPLRPPVYGKPERRSNVATKVTLQLFKITTNTDRIIATLANNGTISFFLIKAMHLANSKTNNPTAALRPLMVSFPLDPKEYRTTRNNSIVYNNSTPEMAKVLFAQGSPFNSAIVKGSIASQYIPHFVTSKETPELNWDNQAHNLHAKRLAVKLTEIGDLNLTDADKSKAYKDAWDSYQKSEQDLIDKGILVPNMIVVADTDGLIPTVSVNQQMSSANKFFDSKSLFGNENSTATYAPLINEVSAVVAMSNTAVDPNSNWVYGRNSLSPDDATRSIQATSVEVYGYDFTNQKAPLPMRVVVTDTYTNVNAKEGNTRSERFQDFSENNSQAEINNAELTLGFATGGLTSIFSIGGDNIYYRTHTSSEIILDSRNLDMDKEVELDLGDLISVDAISLDSNESINTSVDNSVSDIDFSTSSSEF